jgi:hypothetical protein
MIAPGGRIGTLKLPSYCPAAKSLAMTSKRRPRSNAARSLP